VQESFGVNEYRPPPPNLMGVNCTLSLGCCAAKDKLCAAAQG